MPEPFKNGINPSSIREIGEGLHFVDATFPLDAFMADATDGLDALELKARVAHVADALRAHLPAHWPDALELLIAALPPPLLDATEVSSGFALWPILHAVQVHGRGHPELSVDGLHPMTRRFSAEFAIRPYLTEHPEVAWGRVERWVDDGDVHVRRLCSEGTRPRLPWGTQLRASVADPSRGLQVLHRLVDDPERYVRLSVANHLNDISKDHPERAVAVAQTWLARPTPHREQVVRRGLRTLVKKGDAAALGLLGFGQTRARLDGMSVTPDPVAIGSKARLSATLVADRDEAWMVDWIIRAPRADGSLGHRVLKGKQVRASGGQPIVVTQSLSLEPVTTRVTRPGRWQVAVQVNGSVLGEVDVDVTGEAR